MYADPSVSDETDFLPFSFFFSQFIFIANHLRAAKCSLTLMYYRSREAGLHLLPPKQCASIPFPLQALQQLLPDAITSLEQEQLGLVCGLDSLKRRVKKGINYLIVLWKKKKPAKRWAVYGLLLDQEASALLEWNSGIAKYGPYTRFLGVLQNRWLHIPSTLSNGWPFLFIWALVQSSQRGLLGQ